MANSKLEAKFIEVWGTIAPQYHLDHEVKLIEKRRFRFDFVHEPSKLAIEVNGGIFCRGRHSRGKGQQRDYEKILLATRLGYSVVCVGSGQITPDFLVLIKDCIEARLKSNPKKGLKYKKEGGGLKNGS